MVIKQMQVGHMAVFAYIVGDEASGEGLVIDPAADTDRILSEATAAGLTIKYIVNTHGHVDHTSGNADMKAKTGAELIIHRDDADMLLSTPPMMLRMFGGKASPPADKTVVEGDRITVGSVELEVIHTPGHSPGGMALYTPGYVFTGDTLFVEGLGRTDLPGASWEAMYASITQRLLTLPDDTVVLPGHNYGRTPTSTIQNERVNNPFLR
ncbi:MAG: MBL fold metallo-hydrolase [Deltaproteobacteria bacterium]|nr:MBL fold metallo-hydrolase [Deltaproteobacteria bacterium]